MATYLIYMDLTILTLLCHAAAPLCHAAAPLCHAYNSYNTYKWCHPYM